MLLAPQLPVLTHYSTPAPLAYEHAIPVTFVMSRKPHNGGNTASLDENSSPEEDT